VFALLLALVLSQPAPAAAVAPAGTVVDGHGSPTVTIPRIDATVEVDGRLDEAPWSRAARLGGFSQYQPVDGRPSEERTEVLVWYSPTAMYFGIIAHDREPGSIRATMADRDSLDRDDTVTIYLDTFDDRRRAFFFTVNPLGVQQDGVQTEGAFNAGTMFGGTSDKNPDYQWDSKGRLTDDGFVVEVRIPFKSLRYPGNGAQRWGLNIQRKVQRTGYQDTWTDVHRAGSSFLAQAGAIDGLHDMKRGVVTELQPFVTTASNGAVTGSGDFSRDKTDVNPGANLRFGFTNLSIDGTVNPDFSQVESDAGQVTVNQRFALFYAEKRPFFLEGIELFSTPNQLVYTRQIVAPIAGGKVTGKFGRLNVAYLSVKEKENAGAAWFNVARVRGDLGQNSTVGITLTDRTANGDVNRVAAVDSRIVFARLYYVQGQVGRSWTGESAARRVAPIWLAEFDRTGRMWGFNYKLTGIGPGFEARSGYVPRQDIVELHTSNRLSWYGPRGALVEQFTTFFGPSRIWRYADFGHASPSEGNENVNLMLNLRGGWSLRSELSRSFVRFDPRDYGTYQVQRQDGPAPFVVPRELSGLPGVDLTAGTPTFRTVNASLEVMQAAVAIFPEASEGRETGLVAGVSVRPTGSIRVEGSGTYSRITRARDASEFARTVIPRLKLEYQPTRALFFRIVGEYRSEQQAALLDPVTVQPLMRDGGVAGPERVNALRLDCLVSYEPTPGTVAFFGYGSSLDTNRTLSLQDLRRQSDGFFVKLAYLFRR
jgi:Domain of unknown function (DUF5916)